MPEQAQVDDLVINEILADPLSGGGDYVELYNNSDKFLDIADLIISNTTRTSGRDKNVETSLVLKPGEYVVLTPEQNLQAVLLHLCYQPIAQYRPPNLESKQSLCAQEFDR